MMYDVVIIGAGPAGISAGIYAASRGKKVLITEKKHRGRIDRKSIYRYPLCGNYDRRNRKFFCQETENPGRKYRY